MRGIEEDQLVDWWSIADDLSRVVEKPRCMYALLRHLGVDVKAVLCGDVVEETNAEVVLIVVGRKREWRHSSATPKWQLQGCASASRFPRMEHRHHEQRSSPRLKHLQLYIPSNHSVPVSVRVPRQITIAAVLPHFHFAFSLLDTHYCDYSSSPNSLQHRHRAIPSARPGASYRNHY
jgi:hypothetical protein